MDRRYRSTGLHSDPGRFCLRGRGVETDCSPIKECMMPKFDEAKGRAKEAAGDVSDNDDLKREGKVDQASSSIKDKVGDVADKVKDTFTKD